VNNENGDIQSEFERFVTLVAEAAIAVDVSEEEQVRLKKEIGMELSALALRFDRVGPVLAYGASRYLLPAADQGDPEAAYEVAELCVHAENSNGLEDGFDYYKIAASKGHAQAIYQLARCYLTGQGPSMDLDRAAELFAEAKRLGADVDPDHLEFEDLTPEQKRVMRWSFGGGKR